MASPCLLQSGFARLAKSLAIALFVLTAFGCDGGLLETPYEPSWRFPLRDDPIVIQPPPVQPNRSNDPSQIDADIRQFKSLGGLILDPQDLSPEAKTEITAALDELFGTPAQPRVLDIEPELAEAWKLSDSDLQRASVGYKLRCANCHGMSGNGRGPAGLWTDPHPRDFRSGQYKAASGIGIANARPRLADIKRVLKLGVPGMGSTGLSNSEIEAMTGYTVFLSLRGEVEQQLLRQYLDMEEVPPTEPTKEAKRLLAECLKAWQSANADGPLSVVVPPRPDSVTPEYREQLRRGAALFASNKTACMSCHVDYGRVPQYRYDVWGAPNRVRNLTDKERYWIKEPADLARIIRHGIPAANMPANLTLSDAEVQDLAAFVQELPYPARLPEDLPGPEAKGK